MSDTSRDSKAAQGEEKPRIIDVYIDHSQHANRFEKNDSFFKEQLEDALHNIRELVAGIPREPIWHRHDTIAILGGRGLGKTSFVLTLLKLAADDGASGAKQSKVAPLEPLDPTLIEKNEVFLATVCSAIMAKLEEEKHNGALWNNQNDLRDALEELARSFPILSPHNHHVWPDGHSDPMELAERMLRNTRSGASLARHFARFVDAAAKALGVDAFLLPLDDVDTTVERGWEVLEVLRKYLATPRLITLLSGDLSLYQMLVLGHNYEELKPLIEGETRRKDTAAHPSRVDAYLQQARVLRDQYLQKILPPHRRIHLHPVRDRLSNPRNPDAISLQLYWNRGGDEVNVPLEALLGQLFRDLFGWPSGLSGGTEHDRLWRSPAIRLLPSNTRSLLRVLKALCRWHVPAKAEQERTARPAVHRAIELDPLWQVYQAALYQSDVKLDNLRALAAGQGMDWLAHRIMAMTVTNPEAYLLSGESAVEDEEQSQADLLVQGALYRGTRVARHVSGLLEYGLRCVAPALIVRSSKEPEEKRKELAYRVPLGSHVATVDVAGYLRAATWDREHLGPGYMRLLNRRRGKNMHPAIAGLGKKLEEFEEREKRFAGRKKPADGKTPADDPLIVNDYGLMPWWSALKKLVEKRKNDYNEQDVLPTATGMWHSAGGVASYLLGLFYQELQNAYRQTFVFIDIYQGLGILSELLSTIMEKGEEGDDVTAESIERFIKQFIERRANETRTYPLYQEPGVENVVEEKKEEEEGEENRDGDTDGKGEKPLMWDELINAFASWCQAARKLSKLDSGHDAPPLYLPAPVMGRIFADYDKQLGRMVGELPLTAWSVGAMMQRWVTAFWQILLLAEMEYRMGPDIDAVGFNRTGIVRSTGGFEYNLERLLKKKLGKEDNTAPEPVDAAALRWQLPRNALLWMSCPALLAACRKELRDKIREVIDAAHSLYQASADPVLQAEASWLELLKKTIETVDSPERNSENNKPFTKCTWSSYGRHWNAKTVYFDIHELWSALFVAPGKGTSPTDKDYDAFTEITGLQLKPSEPPAAKPQKSR